MPHDNGGKPYEVLLNPLGVISRCYDDQTEFLTERGWVFGKDVTTADRFACYHTPTGNLYLLDQLEAFHAAPYKGPMLRFQNKLMDFCVTPNHRMWAKCGYPGATWQEVPASRIAFHDWVVPVAGNPVKGTDEPFVLPQIDRQTKDSRSDRSLIEIDPGDWAEFLGWYVAEGNVDDKVHVSQSHSANAANCRHIVKLLKRLPFAWNYNEDNTQFHVTSKRLCDYIKSLGLGLCADKFIPEWVFKQSPATRQRFLDGYLAGDGCKDSSERARDYTGAGTMSPRLAADLQRLLIYQGVSSNVALQPASSMWRTAIYLKKHRVLEAQNWKKVQYDGTVYCPTVPTGYVVTRRNGKMLIAGNTNPAQWAEAKLGAIAAKTGRSFKAEDWDPNIPDRIAWVEKLMQQHGLPDTEDVIDPKSGKAIHGVYTGNRFFMKLHHTAESKGQGRGGGAYSSDETPAKGGETGSKRISLLDSNALLSHGATQVLRDAGAIRGQKNDDYWLQFMQGFTPREPRVPMVYNKFIAQLKASGINVVRDGSQLHVMAMTDKDVDTLAGDRNLKHGDTVHFDKGLEPIEGGLFDSELTGGHHGTKWAAVPLSEAMPNPVMEEPIRRVLGLTGNEFEDTLAGKHTLPDYGTGPSAIAKALGKVNVDSELAKVRATIEHGSKSSRDAAIRKLGYLKSAKRLGIHPKDWMMSRVPVLPPQFRPVSLMSGSNVPLVDDPNFLYKELHEADKNLGEMKQQLGDEGVGAERLAVYNAFKAVTGLGEPITQQSRDKEVHGILRSIFGSSPKFGTVQRKLISSTVDNVGRAVITPNPDLDMDSVGLPEDRAFDVYSRFVVRRLKRQGMPMMAALQEIKDKGKLARKALEEEMGERPVIINRAPVLHRFGIMAFRPRLTKGSTLQISPLVVKGFNADFDGDAMQYHVPTDEAARVEALERMLPSHSLLSPADFKSPVHVPSQEYVGGIYAASTNKSKRPERTFRSKADAIASWLNKEIEIGDAVHILEEQK